MPRGIGLAPRKLGGKARAESLHCFSTEPLFLIRLGLRSAARKPGGQTGAESPHFLRRNHFSSFPSVHYRPVQEVRPARVSLVGGTSFPHALELDGPPRKLGGVRPTQSRCTFSRRNHFSSFASGSGQQ